MIAQVLLAIVGSIVLLILGFAFGHRHGVEDGREVERGLIVRFLLGLEDDMFNTKRLAKAIDRGAHIQTKAE